MKTNRVTHLCQVQGIYASHAKKRRIIITPVSITHDDLLAYVDKHGRTRHYFTTSSPNEKWITVISEYPTGEGNCIYAR
jgi:hypothetical protein